MYFAFYSLKLIQSQIKISFDQSQFLRLTRIDRYIYEWNHLLINVFKEVFLAPWYTWAKRLTDPSFVIHPESQSFLTHIICNCVLKTHTFWKSTMNLKKRYYWWWFPLHCTQFIFVLNNFALQTSLLSPTH